MSPGPCRQRGFKVPPAARIADRPRRSAVSRLLIMVDRVTAQRRSRIMQSVGTANTGPEMAVRRALHRRGFRYSLHRRDLPGSPDIVFPSRRKILFVHGCFWHGHSCRWGKLPKSRLEYWRPKIEANRKRDARNVKDLQDDGWGVLVVWQCELRDQPATINRIVQFLETA